VIRRIESFHQDDEGDWVADLSCLHGQHVRHDPPFQERPWVQTAEGRAARVGTDIECPLCDRAELPEGLVRARIAGPFDEATLPAGLRRAHRVADRTWGVLEVLDGQVDFEMATEPRIEVRLGAGARQPIPPGVPHQVTLVGPARVAVDFLVPPDRRGTGR
jgi:tellurite resistance-related uncharacterized protein